MLNKWLLTFLLLCNVSTVLAQSESKMLLVGDSYMAGLSPYFKQVWPDSKSITKTGSGLHYWKNKEIDSSAKYVIISLGINDLPKNVTKEWINNYSKNVTLFLNKFPKNTAIHWILPPCNVHNQQDYVRDWVNHAIQLGINNSGKNARVIKSDTAVCSYMNKDLIHFSSTGYQMIANNVIR